MRHSQVSLITAILAAIGAYAIGFTHAWTRQAYQDWKTRKHQMRAQRRLFFRGAWQLLRYGAAGLVIVVVLTAWVVRDWRDGERETPLVPGSARCASSAPGPSPPPC